MSRIFISHSSSDNGLAIGLRDWLVSEGWDDLFLDVDPERGIAPGERWERALNEAAHRCEAVLLLISRAWLKSSWCLKEFFLAAKLNKRMFGVLIEDIPASELPHDLTAIWQTVDLWKGSHQLVSRVILPDGREQQVAFSKTALIRLKTGLTKAGLDPSFFPWPPSNDADRPPYRGLRPLESDDAGIFFGREAPIIETLDRLRGLREATPPRLIAILGASGAGKSSFLRAGLIPRLSRDDRNFFVLPVVRPERAVITGETGLLRSITAVLESQGHERIDFMEELVNDSAAILALLAEITKKATPPSLSGDIEQKLPTIVLAIDQGEELFQSEGADEAKEFLALIRDVVLASAPNVIVLVTIRSDSYELLQSAPSLEGIQQHTQSLPPLPRGSYQTVIEGPASRLRGSSRAIKIDPRLTEALMADIEASGAKDALPLLAFTLERLYLEHGRDGDLKLSEYLQLGGLSGSIEAAVERALTSADSDPFIPKDHSARLALLRRAFIPWLASVDPDTGLPRRAMARISEIPEDCRAIIRHLVDQRLVATDTSYAGDQTVEPAHEALLRQWSLLKGWLIEDSAALSALEAVKRTSRDWAANMKSSDWLAHAAGRLEDAELLKARADLSKRLTFVDLEYIAACRTAETQRKDRELLEARKLTEAQRQYAEEQTRFAEAQKAIADEQKKVAQEQQALASEQRRNATAARKAGRRIKVAAAVAVMLAIVATGLAYYGFNKATEALNQTKLAIQKTEEAVSEQQRATLNETRAFAGLSKIAATEGTPEEAVKLALVAWPRVGDEKRPQLRNTVEALSVALPKYDPHLQLAGHESPVVSAVFSPDGARVGTVSEDKTARIWNAETGELIALLKRHQRTVWTIDFSPSQDYAVTASNDDNVIIWDVKTADWLAVLSGHDDSVSSALFSPDGTRIVSASDDGTARLWDVRTRTEIARMEHGRKVFAANFSGDGTRIVTASGETARVWEVPSGTELTRFEKHRGLVTSSTFSPDGKRVISVSYDDTARIWDAVTGEELFVLKGHGKTINSAMFSPDGTQVVTASEDHTAWVWDANTGARIVTLVGHKDGVSSAQFSPNSKLVLTTSADRTARLWDARSGKQIREIVGHADTVWSGNFSPDGGRIVTSSRDGTAVVWDIRRHFQVMELGPHDNAVYSVDFSPDGTRLVTASGDNTARLWSVKSGEQIAVMRGHTNDVRSATFSPDGSVIVTASVDNTAIIWNGKTGTLSLSLKGHEGPVNTARFSPDGTLIVTASDDKTARLWNTAGQEVAILRGHEHEVRSAIFSPDGFKIVTFSEVSARIWNAKGGIVALLKGHKNNVTSATFSKDGSLLVTTSWDNTARVWGVAASKLIAILAHADFVVSADFSPDSKWLVTASTDGAARVWNASTGEQALLLNGHTSEINSVMYSADGRRIVTASMDRTARLWDANSGAQLEVLGGHEKSLNSAVFDAQTSHVATSAGDKSVMLWDISNLETGDAFRIACLRLGRDTSLKELEQRYGIGNVMPICDDHKPLPIDLTALRR